MDTDIETALARIEESWRASGLTESTICTYARNLNPMRRLAGELGSTCIDQALLDAYVEEGLRRGLGSTLLKNRLTVAGWVCRVLGLPPYPTDSAGNPVGGLIQQVPERFAGSYQGFVSALGASDLADGTIKAYGCSARMFLTFLGDRVGSLAEIGLSHVEDFLAFKSQTCALPGLKNHKSGLLAFLRHLQREHVVPEMLVLQVSQLKMKPEQPRAQRFLSEGEAAAMLRAAERTQANPKRTLLIVAMLIQYSMRCIDLREMLVSDISWGDMTVRVGSQKTGGERVFPLTETVKYVVLDYLKNERPECDCPYLLVTTNKPHRKVGCSTSVRKVLKRVAREAGVAPGYRFGTHTFRRTGATTLMACGLDYASISEHLMHASPAKGLSQSTMRYLSIDVERLRGAALEVSPHAAR